MLGSAGGWIPAGCGGSVEGKPPCHHWGGTPPPCHRAGVVAGVVREGGVAISSLEALVGGGLGGDTLCDSATRFRGSHSGDHRPEVSGALRVPRNIPQDRWQRQSGGPYSRIPVGARRASLHVGSCGHGSWPRHLLPSSRDQGVAHCAGNPPLVTPAAHETSLLRHEAAFVSGFGGGGGALGGRVWWGVGGVQGNRCWGQEEAPLPTILRRNPSRRVYVIGRKRGRSRWGSSFPGWPPAPAWRRSAALVVRMAAPAPTWRRALCRLPPPEVSRRKRPHL